MRYRKKPVVIEAVKYLGGSTYAEAPNWLVEACKDGTVYLMGEHLFVRTLEGEMTASLGDYIIRGVHGEIYPCKPDIFEETYEMAEVADKIEP